MVDSIENLYLSILTSFENGYKPSKLTVDLSRNASLEAGSLQTLRVLYPWHPSFQSMEGQSNTEMLAIDFQYETNDTNRNTQQQKLSPMRHGTVVSGGIEWMIASQQAESKLEGARVDTQREMDVLVKRAKRISTEENIPYVEAFLRIQQVSIATFYLISFSQSTGSYRITIG
jgi:hypothetical protein